MASTIYPTRNVSHNLLPRLRHASSSRLSHPHEAGFQLPLPRRSLRPLRSFATTHPSNNTSNNPNQTTNHTQSKLPIVDLRSDTLTQPSLPLLQTALHAPTGDDVLNEDPTLHALEAYSADLFQKERALFLPTATMANLCAILSHCHYNRSAEMIMGRNSHINLYEGGGYANLAGVSSKLVEEDEDAKFDMTELRDAFRRDDDDHYAKTTLVCLENTHNILGGVALDKEYVDQIGTLVHEEWKMNEVKLHIDGARIFNSAIAQNISVSDLCESADSVSFCLSKGLGCPLGAVLVGDDEFIRLARRARKRLGGGMRQAGVVAAMGMHALVHHVERLAEDHVRARRLAEELKGAGFYLPREGRVDTNIVFFGLPEDLEKCKVTKEELPGLLLEQYGVKIAGGYSSGGRLFRLVTHMDIDDEGIERAIEGIISLCIR